MTIIFDLSGKDRKQLVKAISEITGARAEYQRMPTCAFVIEFFTVTKEGTLEFPDRSDTELVELVLDELAEKGFTMTSAVNESGQSEMFDSNENSETAETPTQPDTAAVTEAEKVYLKSGRTRTLNTFAYIMDEQRQLGVPNGYYINTCLNGYDSFGFDKELIFKAIDKSLTALKKKKGAK